MTVNNSSLNFFFFDVRQRFKSFSFSGFWQKMIWWIRTFFNFLTHFLLSETVCAGLVLLTLLCQSALSAEQTVKIGTTWLSGSMHLAVWYALCALGSISPESQQSAADAAVDSTDRLCTTVVTVLCTNRVCTVYTVQY